MGVLQAVWLFVRGFFAGRAALMAENLALRRQLAVLQRSGIADHSDHAPIIPVGGPCPRHRGWGLAARPQGMRHAPRRATQPAIRPNPG